MELPYPLDAYGKSGKAYSFSLHTKDSKFKEVGAVYIFIKEEVNRFRRRRYIPLYIGETKNLRNRINDHEKWPCVNKHGCTHIAIMPVPREKDRLYIETDLRHAHSTVCNAQ